MARAESMNVVIGAASGMGAAVAALLAPRGPLLLADRDADRLAALAADLGATTMACDITAAADVQALRKAVDRLGALVVTAGLSPSMAGGRRIFEVNLLGLERVVRAFEGAIGAGSAAVCFASVAGHMMPALPAVDAVLDQPLSETFFDDVAKQGFDPDNPALAYALSKRGVRRLVQRHAAAWGAKGARILSLSPGIVDTGMGRLEADNQPMMAGMVASSSLARMGRPEEVAAVAAFLVSDAASFMTGTDVLVDGGAMAPLQR
jgi:NAD(P)-dependent dehydrogenase (short-subunit alcohol dehydrogenase family)